MFYSQYLRLRSIILVCATSIIMCTSCSDFCDKQICENGGLCVDGTCECPDGFLGLYCERFDKARIQEFLDSGTTPMQLYNVGISLNELYGKKFNGGLIFYLDTINGSVLIASMNDQSSEAEWGCVDMNMANIMDVFNCADDCQQPEPEDYLVGARIGDGLFNTNEIISNCSEINYACKLCRNIGPEWFLPSRGELNLMYTNLYLKSLGNFNFSGVNSGWYWSSTERGDGAWFQDFSTGNQNVAQKNFELYVRAVSTFDD